jgi:hypothetical protein
MTLPFLVRISSIITLHAPVFPSNVTEHGPCLALAFFGELLHQVLVTVPVRSSSEPKLCQGLQRWSMIVYL